MLSRFIRVNGLLLHYLEWGDPRQPPLLLLHGSSAHAHWWTFFVEALGEEHRVLALDLRGHGDSERAIPPRYDLESHAGDIARFVEALGLTNLCVMGHSYGGLVAMQYAGVAAGRLARLMVIDIGPQLSERGARYLRAIRVLPHPVYASLDEAVARFQLLPRANGARREVLEHVARFSFRRTADGTWIPKFDRRAMGDTGACDLRPRIRNLRCPILFVRGQKSRALSASDAAQIAEVAPMAELATIPNAHHHVMLDEPEALARVVRDFVTRRAEPTSPPLDVAHRARLR